jgi:large conductance mechanosensitive channel
MPPIRLEDSREILNEAGGVVRSGARRVWDGFSDFALQENVIGVAVGLM